ncbi:MAG: four helix bundle protein [Saprospiraceae bacterium]
MLLEIYRVTKEFPADEKFGMISDMRRAANTVAHNIAEGFGRFENKDKSRFYKISRGSSYEFISQLFVSHALHFLSQDDKENLTSGYKVVINELDLIIKAVESR